MFCSKCGNELNDDASFCSKCGNKIEVAMPNAGQVVYVQQPVEEKPKKKKKALPVIILLLLLLLFAFFKLFSGVPAKTDIEKYSGCYRWVAVATYNDGDMAVQPMLNELLNHQTQPYVNIVKQFQDMYQVLNIDEEAKEVQLICYSVEHDDVTGDHFKDDIRYSKSWKFSDFKKAEIEEKYDGYSSGLLKPGYDFYYAEDGSDSVAFMFSEEEGLFFVFTPELIKHKLSDSCNQNPLEWIPRACYQKEDSLESIKSGIAFWNWGAYSWTRFEDRL